MEVGGSFVTAVQELNVSLRHFLAVASVGDLDGIYRNKHVWVNNKLEDLYKPGAVVLQNLPAARLSVLSYLGLLVHESLHFHLLQKETGNAPDCTTLSEAVESFMVLLQSELEFASARHDIWRGCLLKWSSELLAELSQRNSGRRVVASASTTNDLLKLYTSCRSVRLVAELFNSSLKWQFNDDPEKTTSILIDTARFGAHFDWVLSYVGNSLPPSIGSYLLSVGLTAYAEVIESCAAAVGTTPATSSSGSSSRLTLVENQLRDRHRIKFRSMASIISHLSRRTPSDSLRQAFRDGFLNGIGIDADAKMKLMPALLLKLTLFSPEIMMLILDCCSDLLTSTNINAAVPRIVAVPSEFVGGHETDIRKQLSAMVLKMNQSATRTLFDIVYNFVFDQATVSVEHSIKDHGMHCLELILSRLSKHIHSQFTYFPLDNFTLEQMDAHLTEYLQQLFTLEQQSDVVSRKFHFRLLTLLVMTKGSAKATEVFTWIMCEADTDDRLAAFHAFVDVLKPFMPNCVNDFGGQLLYWLKLRTTSSNKRENCWKNVAKILKSERNSGVTSSSVGLCDAIHNSYGQFCWNLLSFECQSDRTSSQLENCLQVLDLLGPPAPLSPRFAIKIADAHAHCILICLARIAEEEKSDTTTHSSVKLFESACTVARSFLDSQGQAAHHIFLQTLTAQAFESYDLLFSAGPRPKAMLEDDSELSLSNQNRRIGEASVSGVVAVAHSGVIARKPPQASTTSAIQERSTLWRLLLVDFIQSYCQQSANNAIPSTAETTTTAELDVGGEIDLVKCREVASILTERLCVDAIGAQHHWGSWELERDDVSRFLEIEKTVEKRSFVWDMLRVIAQVSPCLWFCAPIVKAILGSLMAKLENASDKATPPSEQLLKTLDRWFLLVNRGNLLPHRLAAVYSTLHLIDKHEAFLILLDIWRYFEASTPPILVLNQKFERLQLNREGTEMEIETAPAEQYLVMCRVVIQANIERLGHLYPQLFPESVP